MGLSLAAFAFPASAGYVIAGAGPGSVPRIKIYGGSGNDLLADFLAFGPEFTGGVSVAPEPATLGLVVVGALTLARRRARTR